MMPNGYAAITNKVLALRKERRRKENFLHKDEVNHIEVNAAQTMYWATAQDLYRENKSLKRQQS